MPVFLVIRYHTLPFFVLDLCLTGQNLRNCRSHRNKGADIDFVMMAINSYLFPALLLALRARSYALPEPYAAVATAKPVPNPVHQAHSAEITARALPQNATLDSANSDAGSYFDPAVLASESAALESFFAEANVAGTAGFAAFSSAIHPHLDASESAFLRSRQSQWTKTVGASAPAVTAFDGQVAVGEQSASVERGSVTADAGNVVVAQQASDWKEPIKAPFDSNSQSYETGANEITCLDSSKYELKTHDINYSACSEVELAICASLNDPSKLVTDQWAWADNGQGCAMGYWLPKLGAAGTALVPPKDLCQHSFFDRSLAQCIPRSGGGGRWNAISVNVERLPVWNDAGQQNDPAKISILIAGSAYPCGLQDCAHINPSSSS